MVNEDQQLDQEKAKEIRRTKWGIRVCDAVKTMRKTTFRGVQLENWDWLGNESMKEQSKD